MAFSKTITITGMDEVLRNLNAYGERARQAAAQALFEEASAIEQESVTRYVPVDLGGLRDSAKTILDDRGDKISAEIRYDAPYAAVIHENPRAGRTGGVSPSGRKYKHWATTGGFKYLEIPFMAAESGMLGRLADRMRSILRGG